MKYPIGIQDFGSIREGGYVYVDKTRDIFNVLNSGSYLEAFADGTKKRIAGGGQLLLRYPPHRAVGGRAD